MKSLAGCPATMILVFAAVGACTFDDAGIAAPFGELSPDGAVAPDGTQQPLPDPIVAPDASPIALPVDARTNDDTLPLRVRLSARIDGRSLLTLKASAAGWHHLDFAAPGRHEGRIDATMIGETEWFPNWPDEPNPENRDCDCRSDRAEALFFDLPEAPMNVSITEIAVRESVAVIESPSAGNGYRAVIEFDDRSLAGSAVYGIDVDFSLLATGGDSDDDDD